MNEEFQVNLTLITSLPFVHTARRCPELSNIERQEEIQKIFIFFCVKSFQSLLFEPGKSRNKVFVGEPAKGSFRFFI
uniref:Uncharacterized protein n=1 Tax=Strongyloides venezuelensis TaxID=75913 RepID=A0A0K0FLX7_STRVS